MQPSDAIWGVSLSSGCAGTGCLVRYGNLWTVNTGLSTSPARFTFYAGWGGIEGLYGTNSVFDLYMATRTNTGWVTTLPGSTGKEALLAARHRCSDSMEMCIDHNDGDPIYHYESVPVETQAGLYDWKGHRMGVLPTNVNTVPGGGHEIGNQFGDETLSGDFTHFAFSKLNYAFAPGGVSVLRARPMTTKSPTRRSRSSRKRPPELIFRRSGRTRRANTSNSRRYRGTARTF